jgi:integrase
MASGDTFEAIAQEWLDKFSASWAVGYSSKVIRRLEICVFPWIGSISITQIKARELLACLRRVEARGKLGTAHRALQVCARVFRYAVATGRAERDSSGDLRGALPPKQEKHFVHRPKSLAGLLRAIEAYEGSQVVRSALCLTPLLFVRPGELRAAEWREFNLDAGEWRIGAERMKMPVQHIVPLSGQAVAISREMERVPVASYSRTLAPTSDRCQTTGCSLRSGGLALSRVCSPSTAFDQPHRRCSMSKAVIRMPSSASSLTPSATVRAAYNYAEYLPELRKMMQAWADYLDALKVDAASSH